MVRIDIRLALDPSPRRRDVPAARAQRRRRADTAPDPRVVGPVRAARIEHDGRALPNVAPPDPAGRDLLLDLPVQDRQGYPFGDLVERQETRRLGRRQPTMRRPSSGSPASRCSGRHWGGRDSPATARSARRGRG